MDKQRTELLKAVKAGKDDALEMLVDLFDWLDGLEPQPTMKTVLSHGHRVSIVAKIADPLSAQMMGLLKKARKVQEGVRKVMSIFIRK